MSPRIALLAAALLALPPAVRAQVEPLPAPWASPRAHVTQVIGVSEVTLDFGRPGLKGRDVWGNPAVVPWNAVWRAGANENTTITFSDDATVEGRPLARGTYGLHMIPRPEGVTLIFSANATSWGSYRYDEAEDVLRVEVAWAPAPPTEWMDFDFTDLAADGATCRLLWGERAVPFRIGIDTHHVVLAYARDVYLRGRAGFNWQGWNAAARYCLANGVELEQGLAWAERAVALSANMTSLGTQAGLLEKLGRSRDAAALQERALALATETELNALGYQQLNAGRTAEALATFERATRTWPGSWNAWDSLAEACARAGDAARAVELYRKAAELAPADQQERIRGELRTLGG